MVVVGDSFAKVMDSARNNTVSDYLINLQPQTQFDCWVFLHLFEWVDKIKSVLSCVALCLQYNHNIRTHATNEARISELTTVISFQTGEKFCRELDWLYSLLSLVIVIGTLEHWMGWKCNIYKLSFYHFKEGY